MCPQQCVLVYQDLNIACMSSNILSWPNTVFARALADSIQRAHKDCKNNHVGDTAIIL